MAPSPVDYQTLPCVDVASCWLVGPGHEAADCRTPGGPGANVGSLAVGVRVQKTLGLLLPTLAGRAGSWSLAAGPRDPRAGIRSLVGRGLVLDTVGYMVHGVLKLVLAC